MRIVEGAGLESALLVPHSPNGVQRFLEEDPGWDGPQGQELRRVGKGQPKSMCFLLKRSCLGSPESRPRDTPGWGMFIREWSRSDPREGREGGMPGREKAGCAAA